MGQKPLECDNYNQEPLHSREGGGHSFDKIVNTNDGDLPGDSDGSEE